MSKHAFWQAFVFTIFIFGIGLFLGFFFEHARVNAAQVTLLNSELNVLDEQVRERAVGTFDVECSAAVNSTFGFADMVYQEAIKLEEYDSSNKFPDILAALHRRYDLLRTMLWVDSVGLRERCGGNFHTVVYLYQYNTDDIEITSKQAYYSRVLYDLKLAHPNDMILIPIASDSDLASLNVLLDKYHLTQTPAIIIDEHTIVDDLATFDQLETIIFKGNN